MLDCLFIGSATRDLLMLVEAPPASDQRIAASAVLTACGGIASVSASAFQKLGGATGLISAVGDPSETTSFIESDLKARGLEYLHIIRVPGTESPFSVIQIEEGGKRCITYYGGCVDRLTMDMLPRERLGEAGMIHIGGLKHAVCTELVRWCRENTEALISVDGGNLTRKTTEAILPYVDVFIPDDKTVARTLGVPPEDACRFYADRGVRYSCVTLGDAGSIALKDGVLYRQSAIRVKAVDTTGAGDNFHGAFLYCLLRGWDLPETLAFCSAYSALTCLAPGGIAGEPSLEETLRFMERT